MKITFEHEMSLQYRPTQDALKECIAAFTQGDKAREEEISISLNRDRGYITKSQEVNRIIGLRSLALIRKAIPIPKALVKVARMEHAERMVVRSARMKKALAKKSWRNTVKVFRAKRPVEHELWRLS